MHKTKLGIDRRRTALPAMLLLLHLATAAEAQYDQGFVWNCAQDWTPRPPSDAGTSNGNPDDDATGRPCWHFLYTQDIAAAGGLGSPTPWYTVATSRSVWDVNWFNAGSSLWARGNDLNPPISRDDLTHTFGNGNGGYAPVLRWVYPGQCPIRVSLSGSVTIVWSGQNVAGNTGQVDVAFLRDATDGALTPLFSGTIDRPPGTASRVVPIQVPSIPIRAGDSVVITLRARQWLGGNNWSVMRTPELSLTVVAEVDGIDQHPASVTICPGGAARFSVVPASPGPYTYRWAKDGVPIDVDVNPSAATATLLLSNVQPPDVASYRCTVSGACGETTSGEATLTICSSDFNCDAAVDFFDYLDFVAAFDAEDPAADFNGDEIVDFFDYLDFVAAFDAGC
jgi:hypothetical protein